MSPKKQRAWIERNSLPSVEPKHHSPFSVSQKPDVGAPSPDSSNCNLGRRDDSEEKFDILWELFQRQDQRKTLDVQPSVPQKHGVPSSASQKSAVGVLSLVSSNRNLGRRDDSEEKFDILWELFQRQDQRKTLDVQPSVPQKHGVPSSASQKSAVGVLSSVSSNRNLGRRDDSEEEFDILWERFQRQDQRKTLSARSAVEDKPTTSNVDGQGGDKSFMSYVNAGEPNIAPDHEYMEKFAAFPGEEIVKTKLEPVSWTPSTRKTSAEKTDPSPWLDIRGLESSGRVSREAFLGMCISQLNRTTAAESDKAHFLGDKVQEVRQSIPIISRRLQCFNCGDFNHFVRNCPSGNRKNPKIDQSKPPRSAQGPVHRRSNHDSRQVNRTFAPTMVQEHPKPYLQLPAARDPRVFTPLLEKEHVAPMATVTSSASLGSKKAAQVASDPKCASAPVKVVETSRQVAGLQTMTNKQTVPDYRPQVANFDPYAYGHPSGKIDRPKPAPHRQWGRTRNRS